MTGAALPSTHALQTALLDIEAWSKDLRASLAHGWVDAAAMNAYALTRAAADLLVAADNLAAECDERTTESVERLYRERRKGVRP